MYNVRVQASHFFLHQCVCACVYIMSERMSVRRVGRSESIVYAVNAITVRTVRMNYVHIIARIRLVICFA